MMILHQNTIKSVIPQGDHLILELKNGGEAFALRTGGNITPKKGDDLTTEHVRPNSFRSPAKRIYINGKPWYKTNTGS